MIHILSTSTKRYVCELCANTPVSFLEEMIKVGLDSYEKPEKAYEKSEKVDEKSGKGDIRSEFNGDSFENRKNELIVTFEKYDFEAIAKNLLELGNTLQKTNDKIVENIGILKADKQKEYRKEAMANNQVKELEELEIAKTSLRNVELENNRLEALNTTYNDEREAINTTHREDIKKLEDKIIELNNKYVKVYGTWEAGHLANEILSKQLDDLVGANKRLEKNLTISLSRNTPTNFPEREESPSKTKLSNDDNTGRVLIFHDSLCRKINNTILSREMVDTKKVWAPDFRQMGEQLNKTQNTETIVLQAFTREITSKSIEEMNEEIEGVVNKALMISKNIVISTIVAREDTYNIKDKIDSINANMKYNYRDNERIFICDNTNLDDEKFRTEDGIHLTQHGTSVLATNLKYKIAEALNVKVKKKNRNVRYNYEGWY